MEKVETLNGVVTQIIQVTSSMMIIRVAPDGWELPEFKPGQFCTLYLPSSAPRCPLSTPEEDEPAPHKMIKRAYSIASSSRSKEYLEFYITLVRSGALTPRIFALKIGDQIGIGQRCVGMFTLDQVPAGKNIILIATGTGVAPYISMLRTNALESDKGKIAVIHGAANSWDLGYSSELTLLQSISSKFSYIPTIVHPDLEPAPWNGHAMLVQDLWRSGVMEKTWGFKPTPENTSIFLCGNPKMVTSMIEALAESSFKEHTPKEHGQIHVEKW